MAAGIRAPLAKPAVRAGMFFLPGGFSGGVEKPARGHFKSYAVFIDEFFRPVFHIPNSSSLINHTRDFVYRKGGNFGGALPSRSAILPRPMRRGVKVSSGEMDSGMGKEPDGMGFKTRAFWGPEKRRVSFDAIFTFCYK